MNTDKRGRGRPPGTGKDDRRALEAVADMVVANPAMRPTTAMRRVWPKATEADVRRFQVKWKDGREELLKAAYARAEARKLSGNVAPRRVRPHGGHVGGPGALRDFSSMSRMVRDVLDGPAARMAREMANSPAARMAQEIANSPTAKMTRELANSPTLAAMRDLENSATMRALRELDSPTMRAIREHQEMMNRLSRGY